MVGLVVSNVQTTLQEILDDISGLEIPAKPFFELAKYYLDMQ